MDNKFVRYCIVEPKCRTRIAVLLLLIVVIVGQSWYKGAQYKKLSALQVKSALIARTSGMKKELKIKEQLMAFKGEVDDTSGNIHISKISGIAMHDGKPSVLIDETVYGEGDAYGEYVVAAITHEKITLVNKKTNARKILYVFE
jgi:hypothetical protein